MPAVCSAAYDHTLQWLLKQPEAYGFNTLHYDEVKALLTSNSMKSAAALFHTYFPTHYFKVLHTLRDTAIHPIVEKWVSSRSLLLLDVGCGSGAATAAVLSALYANTPRMGRILPRDIYCIGVDPNAYALVIYKELLERLAVPLLAVGIRLDFDRIPHGVPSFQGRATDLLERQLQNWALPVFPHALVLQVNIVSPLDRDYQNLDEKYSILSKFGATQRVPASQDLQFGMEESLAYKTILESAKIDCMHFLTVSTNRYLLEERVQEFGKALDTVFSGRHQVLRCKTGRDQVCFSNPSAGRFRNVRQIQDRAFGFDFTTVVNADLNSDSDWQHVISIDNLRLAWVKCRRSLMRESLVDEVELRLFEQNLEDNLVYLQDQLSAYVAKAVQTHEYLAYTFPKSENAVRPRGLSHVEAEVLSVAVIQSLGHKVSRLRRSSYAYRLASRTRGRDNEYLYAHWLDTYKEFIADARAEVVKHTNCHVIRADIKAFYAHIEQQKLIELAAENLGQQRSRRVEWLLKMLLSRTLDNHETGMGLIQGHVGSGFYANIYLSSVDAAFGDGNEWGVKLFRFVDDMILVVPELEDGIRPEDVDSAVLSSLELQLGELNLQLNSDKTEVYCSPTDFLVSTEPDDLLDRLASEVDSLLKPVWVLNKTLREVFVSASRAEDAWWSQIRLLTQHLRHASIFVAESIASRRVSRFMLNERSRIWALQGEPELCLPPLPSHLDPNEALSWGHILLASNAAWNARRVLVAEEIRDLFEHVAEQVLSEASQLPGKSKKLTRRLRFLSGKLAILGFGPTGEVLHKVLTRSPWLIREPAHAIESLARQGFGGVLARILDYYGLVQNDSSEYMRTVTLRAIRWLPELAEVHWRQIVSYCLGGTIPERLMASETWLMLSNTLGFRQQAEGAQQLAAILQNEASLPDWLGKNFKLLLTLYGIPQPQFTVSGDFTALDVVREIQSKDEVHALLDYVEPDIIRSGYYSTVDETDEYDSDTALS